MRRVLLVTDAGPFGSASRVEESIRSIVGPHFDLQIVRFSRYRWWGLLVAVLDPWILCVCLALLIILRETSVVRSSATLALVAFLVLFLLAPLASRVRVAAAVKRLNQVTSSVSLIPNIIALGWGTQVIGTALKTNTGFRANVVVLFECLLPTHFGWKQILSANPQSFRHVRNRVSEKDALPRVAGLLAKIGLLPGVGAAGRLGFASSNGLVRTVQERDRKSDRTIDPGTPLVENIIGSGRGLNRAYFAYFLLPWLWGIDPGEYATWLEFTLAAVEHYKYRDWRRLALTEAELIHSEWTWTRLGRQTSSDADDLSPNSLGNFIRNLIAAYPSGHGRAVTLSDVSKVLLGTYFQVSTAVQAHQHRSPGWEHAVLSLNPSIAILRAVDRYLSSTLSSGTE